MEIMDTAKKIGTFDTSILPFEDCCTVFTPRHPATKPKLQAVVQAEQLLDSKKLIREALEMTERTDIDENGVFNTQKLSEMNLWREIINETE